MDKLTSVDGGIQVRLSAGIISFWWRGGEGSGGLKGYEFNNFN